MNIIKVNDSFVKIYCKKKSQKCNMIPDIFSENVSTEIFWFYNKKKNDRNHRLCIELGTYKECKEKINR